MRIQVLCWNTSPATAALSILNLMTSWPHITPRFSSCYERQRPWSTTQRELE